jgi:hypothetical protein
LKISWTSRRMSDRGRGGEEEERREGEGEGRKESKRWFLSAVACDESRARETVRPSIRRRHSGERRGEEEGRRQNGE